MAPIEDEKLTKKETNRQNKCEQERVSRAVSIRCILTTFCCVFCWCNSFNHFAHYSIFALSLLLLFSWITSIEDVHACIASASALAPAPQRQLYNNNINGKHTCRYMHALHPLKSRYNPMLDSSALSGFFPSFFLISILRYSVFACCCFLFSQTCIVDGNCNCVLLFFCVFICSNRLWLIFSIVINFSRHDYHSVYGNKI